MSRSIVQPITTDLITLGQLVKLVDLIGSGAEVKAFLAEHEVKVNGEHENRRGRKLYAGDTVEFVGELTVRLKSS